MLVDAINPRLPGGATETTVLGPFYVQAAPEHALGDDISNGMQGEPMLVEGTVSRVDGSPLLYNEAHPYLPDLLICRPEFADPLLQAIGATLPQPD